MRRVYVRFTTCSVESSRICARARHSRRRVARTHSRRRHSGMPHWDHSNSTQHRAWYSDILKHFAGLIHQKVTVTGGSAATVSRLTLLIGVLEPRACLRARHRHGVSSRFTSLRNFAIRFYLHMCDISEMHVAGGGTLILRALTKYVEVARWTPLTF